MAKIRSNLGQFSKFQKKVMNGFRGNAFKGMDGVIMGIKVIAYDEQPNIGPIEQLIPRKWIYYPLDL